MSLINFYERFKSNKRLNPGFSKHQMEVPFSSIISCGSGGGKTNLILNLLYLFDRTFSTIIICTKAEEPLYDFLLSKIKTIKIHYNGEIPNFENIEEPNNGLVIFDDLVLDRNPKIGEMFIRGRKLGYSRIMISQNYYRIDKTIRINCMYYFIGRGMLQRDLNLILSEMAIPIDKIELNKLYNQLTREKMNFMLIDLQNKNIRSNITDIIYKF
jgi:hypothetical protein